jgi:hypothetical protein
MATTGGAWDNAKKWNEKCASEGEPVDAAGKRLTFTHYGVKIKGQAENLPEFRAMVAQYGIDSMVDAEMRAQFTGPDGETRLFYHLAKRYHDLHSATVTGDTVGDPFKDTSGPALNVLIKTMTMMALMLAPAYNRFGEWDGFGKTGCIIAASLFVVIGTISYFLVSYFRRLNERKQTEAIAKKKEADRKYLASGGATGYTVAEGEGAGGDSEEGVALTRSLLH